MTTSTHLYPWAVKPTKLHEKPRPVTRASMTESGTTVTLLHALMPGQMLQVWGGPKRECTSACNRVQLCRECVGVCVWGGGRGEEGGGQGRCTRT
jgi:hypothetical protein